MAKKSLLKTKVKKTTAVATSKPKSKKNAVPTGTTKDAKAIRTTSTVGPTQTPSLATIRAWWFDRQGLGQLMSKATPADVLTRCGWARSVAGVGPYLTFYSRAAIGRSAADAAAAKQQIHELPAARGCTYIVPASDFGLALKVGEQFGFAQEMRVASKLGVSEKELLKLCDAVAKALSKGLMEPDQIRERVGSAARNLGEEGKKKGMITTLPTALGKLQSDGIIRRIPTNGRLDQQRYGYELWTNNPLSKFKLSLDEAYGELARKFFRWVGPATLTEFSWFAGIGVKASAQATAKLGLRPLADGDPRMLFPDDYDKLMSFKIPKEPRYRLVSGLDSIFALRRDVRSFLDPGDDAVQVLGERTKVALGGLSDLSDHAILDRGRLIGLWLFDPTQQKIVWFTWAKPSASLRQAVTETERFVQQDLGDARYFSLDSPKSRAPRIEFIRKIGN